MGVTGLAQGSVHEANWDDKKDRAGLSARCQQRWVARKTCKIYLGLELQKLHMQAFSKTGNIKIVSAH